MIQEAWEAGYELIQGLLFSPDSTFLIFWEGKR